MESGVERDDPCGCLMTWDILILNYSQLKTLINK